MKQPFLTLVALSLLLLAGAFFLPDQPPPAAASSHTDLDRLRDLYVKTGGHTHWARHCKEQWDYQFDDETSIVTLGAGRVVALRLAGCGLVGPIPGSMMELTRLQVLSLTDNSLSGPIPKEIGNLSDLVQLDLANNRLDGPIPPHIGNIANLAVLDLENNRLSGELPAKLNELVNLIVLRLNRNYLHGEIPHSFANLGFIDNLRLQETDLSRRTNRLWGCLEMSPGDPNTGVPYCQYGSLPPPMPTPTPRPTRAPLPTPTFTPPPTYTPRPTWTPVPTYTPVPTPTAVPTPTPVVNPKVNFTAVRKEVPFGEPIKLILTLTGHPREWRALDLILNAPDGVTFTLSKHCTARNLCHYGKVFSEGGGPPQTLEIEATASEPGEFTFKVDATWYDDQSDDSNPFKQEPETTVTVLPPKAPFVDLHASKTQVKVGEPVVLTLTAQNFNARQVMTLNLSLPVPDGWSIQQTDLAEACSGGQCFYSKKLGHSDRPTYIGIIVVPNEPGEVDDVAKIEWFYGDGLNDGEKEVPLKLTVDPALPTPSPIPTPPPPGTTPSPSPGPTAEQPPTPANTATPAPASPLPPTAAPAPTAAAPTAAPPANTGGGCNPESAGSPLNGGGDLTLLGLTILGLMGWGGYRRRKSGPLPVDNPGT